jgi:hypothetical protein
MRGVFITRCVQAAAVCEDCGLRARGGARWCSECSGKRAKTIDLSGQVPHDARRSHSVYHGDEALTRP